MVIINMLILFPIIVSPYNESKPEIERRNSGYIIVYEMEGNKIYGANLNLYGNLIDTFKIAEPLWNGDLKIPKIARVSNDTFFVVYQYEPHIPISDSVYYSILGRNIFYVDSVSLGQEKILYEGYWSYGEVFGYFNPVIKGGVSGFLLMVQADMIEPVAVISAKYSFRTPTGETINTYDEIKKGMYAADFCNSCFYMIDRGRYPPPSDTIVIFKFTQTGNILDSNLLYNTDFWYTFPQMQVENEYLAVVFPFSNLSIYFFHTIDTLKNIFNTNFSWTNSFKLLSNSSYFYLFVSKGDTLKGQRFFHNGVPKDSSPQTIYIDDLPVQNIDGIWDGSRFFIVYEKNNDLYGLFVDSSFVEIKENEGYEKYNRINFKGFVLNKIYTPFFKKDILIYSIMGYRFQNKQVAPGVYIVIHKGEKSKIILLR